MESSAIGTLIGILPFIIGIFIFGLYLFVHSVERRTFAELTELRTNIRLYQKESLRLIKTSSAFSPDDSEPFGVMAVNFNNQFVEFEKSVADIYQLYSRLHQEANRLKLVPIWKLWYLPLQWLSLRQDIELIWRNMEEMQLNYKNVILASEKISNLGIELSTQCRLVNNKLQEASQIYQELCSKLIGNSFLLSGRKLKEWGDTIKTQIPLAFLSADEKTDPGTYNKDSITQVHRVLKTAVPEVNGLFEKLKKWQTDGLYISSSLERMRLIHQQITKLISDLEGNHVSPLVWGESRKTHETIERQLEQLGSEGELLSIEELRDNLHVVKHLEAKQKEFEIICQKNQADYLDLLRMWSSVELQQGSEWVRGARQILEQTKLFAEANWNSLDDLDEFRLEFLALSKMQLSLLPRDPSKAIEERELTNLIEVSRSLYDLHLRLRPRLEKIAGRLKEIQRLQDEEKEKLSRAKSVLIKTGPVISSNPFLKKISGNVPAKLHASLDQLLFEIDTPQQGVIEIKVQRSNEWVIKAEQALGKWLDALTTDLNERLRVLGDKFQTLGNFNNLEDIVITEVKDILKKAEQGENTPPLSRPGDMPLLVIARNLWAKNDLWQKIVSAGRALEDIAGPVLERYQKAEKNRQLLLKRLERGNEVVPDDPGWPPTTQYLRNERKQAQSLEDAWQSLRWEHIQAIQLVGRLSDFSEQYQGLSVQIQQVVEKAEQEQSKIAEYERRLEESKHMWLEVVTKYPENKSLKSDIEKLFTEIDRDFDGLKKRCMHGGLPYNQVLQNMRAIIRKINDAVMPTAGNQAIDINGDVQKRLY